jgi:hypothetical protein
MLLIATSLIPRSCIEAGEGAVRRALRRLSDEDADEKPGG